MMQQQWRSEKPPAMTFDEASMERSKSFVKALQELKNLRPQLYSAAEYCEKSYLHNEQKQMVLDNLKDYAVRALVNAVDHLGTVAYKLTDLFEQQTLDISTMELKVSCLNQQILTCQTYTDKEGLRQQQVSVATPRLHKHYILPSSTSKRFQNIPKHSDVAKNHIQANPHPNTSGTPASKTLSWLLASEDNCAQVETPSLASSISDSKTSKRTYETFHLMDVEQTDLPMPFSTHLHSANESSLSSIPLHTFDLKVPTEVPKPLSAFRSFDGPGKIGKHEICLPSARNKSMLSVFFAKHKSMKPRKTYAI